MAKIYKRPNSPYWWTEFRSPQGERIRKSLKVPNKSTLKEEAKLKASSIEINMWNDWKSGKLDKPIITFDQLMVRWVNERQPGLTDLKSIRSLNQCFGGVNMEDISPDQISRVKVHWAKSGCKNNTIRRRLQTFSSAINYARKHWEWDLNNPITGRLPAPDDFEASHLSFEEAKRLIDAADKRSKPPFNAPYLRDFIILALNTGMRKSEILSCRKEQLDIANCCLYLDGAQQKNRKRSVVPLNTEAMKIIKSRLSYLKDAYPSTEWLFPSPKSNGESPIRDIKKSFDSLRKEIGCPKLRIHDLRHTFASWLVQNDHSIYQVSRALRHSSIKPTQRYSHLELKDLRKTHDLVGNMVKGIMGGQ